MATRPTDSRIESEIDEASVTRFESKYSGMTYEDGVIAALEWVLGQTKDTPMNEDNEDD